MLTKYELARYNEPAVTRVLTELVAFGHAVDKEATITGISWELLYSPGLDRAVEKLVGIWRPTKTL